MGAPQQPNLNNDMMTRVRAEGGPVARLVPGLGVPSALLEALGMPPEARDTIGGELGDRGVYRPVHALTHELAQAHLCPGLVHLLHNLPERGEWLLLMAGAEGIEAEVYDWLGRHVYRELYPYEEAQP